MASGRRYTRKATANLFRAGILFTKEHRKGIGVNDTKAAEFLARFA